MSKESPILGRVDVPINVTAENIDDIVCTAFEGGITYWCDEAEISKKPDPAVFQEIADKDFLVYDFSTWEYASQVISRSGEVTLYDNEAEESHVLTLAKMLDGIKLFLACADHHPRYNKGVINDGGIDCGAIDAEGADLIVQYALFGEIVYG